MKRQLIKDLYDKHEDFVNKELVVKGWVKSLRKSKSFSFIVINDGSSFQDFQIIANDDLPNYDEISSARTGYSLELAGKIVASGGRQPIEMQAQSVKIIGTVDDSYPLQKKATSLEFLRDNAHLRARSNTISAVHRVRHHLAMATHDFFHKRNFYYVNTPIISSSDCEGAGELFRVSTLSAEQMKKSEKIDFKDDYFGTETYLTVSGQLQAESLALGLGSVYTFGPTFRSENSNTSRHLAEFWMVEPEVAFAELDDVAELAKDYIKHLIDWALKNCPDEMEFFNARYDKDLIERLTKVSQGTFQKITYTEAIEILKNCKEKFDFNVEWGIDLQTEHERFLAEKHFNSPVIVTDYPTEIKAFYMKQSADGKTVRAMDVLVPGVGELIGGSQREDNLEILKKRMHDHGLSEKDYWWYLDLRKFGSAPHAGFGLGFERAMMYITGMTNIRDVISFPRFPKSADF